MGEKFSCVVIPRLLLFSSAYKSFRHTEDRKVNLFFYRRANFPLAPRSSCNYVSRTFPVFIRKSDSSIHFPFFSRWSIVLFLPPYLIHSFNSIDSIPRELVNPNFHSVFSSVPPLFFDKMRIRIIQRLLIFSPIFSWTIAQLFKANL